MKLIFHTRCIPNHGKFTFKLVLFQNAGERNFHIFYQLCTVSRQYIKFGIIFGQYLCVSLAQGADQNIRSNYGIAEFDDYNYLARYYLNLKFFGIVIFLVGHSEAGWSKLQRPKR